MDEQKARAAVADMMADRRLLPIVTDRWHAYCLVMAVQLACRHPRFDGGTRRVAEAMARKILDHVLDPNGDGTVNPDLLELSRAGWNPNCDSPWSEDLAAAVQRVNTIYTAPGSVTSGSLTPRPSERDVQDIEKLLIDPAENHLSAHLFRLIKRMDGEHRERLRRVYPHHVAAVEKWEGA
jgi:hypothetical protein